MTTNISTKRLRVLMMARLFIATLVLFYAQFVFPLVRTVFYAFIAAVAILSVFFLLWLVRGCRLRLLCLMQIACDLILESALIYYTGGAESLFASVYVLSILSAGFVLMPSASFYVAGASSMLFLGTMLATHYAIVPDLAFFPRPSFAGREDPVYVFYATYVQITVFFIVAFLTFYFSGRIELLEGKIKAQERLALLGEIISNIAHEIRNPLASISGSVELISKELKSKLTRSQQKLMDAVVEESDRIKRIFSGLLDFTRPAALKLETVSVARFLEQVLMLMRHQEAFHSNVEVLHLYKGKGFPMNVDPEAMKQAIMNLLNNAYEAMPRGGRLEVDCLRNRNEIQISIQDTGNGMDKKTLNSLFIPFRTTKANGTGLGMAQAYKVVNQHGGRITVHSRKHEGTRVDVFLPRSQE